jgi:mannose-1-phosphate guanylyltransferase
MAGGRGERFWPFSTKDYPKQLLRIVSERSMLQDTIERVVDFVPLERTLVVTGENLKEKILERLDFLKADNILTEPMGKNTCAAIGFAAVHLQRQDPDSVMMVLSADHYIKPKERLVELLRVGTTIAARDEVLITIGINPTRPETAYGYIQQGEVYSTFDGISTYRVARFKEKPDRHLAQQYYLDRSHLWNSGMFIWSTKAILNAIEKCQPKMFAQLQEYAEHIGAADEAEARHKFFSEAENVSIDIAILERADNVIVIRAKIIWDDIGSWRALERINPSDSKNNVSIGSVLLHDSFEVTAVNSGDGLIATLGVSDLVIVKTSKAVLVASKTKVDEMKALLERLRVEDGLDEYL